MAPQQQLEKAAWRWVMTVKPEEVSQEHVEIAYRIWLRPCVRGSCRRNCKGNPNCLIGIGEQIWLRERDESSFHKIDDPARERRKDKAFVGLTNLGATCYINTLLQVWFLNLEFRQALYLCPSSSYGDYMSGDGNQEKKDFEPQTICEHLQYLFALLQNSHRRCIDPSTFVKALGLDAGQQQDAQEFSKLLMSLLEDTLSKQKNPDVQNIVQQQFCGEYAYVTICSCCGRESKHVSKFYELELNIQGHDQLTESISEFLKEEKLEGDNQYFCETCQSKQNATRKIRLLNLPCTLNLQLMCFVFDRQTGHKKKLNTYIGFSEILDMKPYIENKAGSFVYELTAVLIHRGGSAYSGHYIAQVKDPLSGEWFSFNDDNIEKMEGTQLELGIEGDVPESSKSVSRRPKCAKGNHCSQNAYMLVYKLQTQEKPNTIIELPPFLRELVDRDNSKFEEWFAEVTEMRKQSVDKGKAKHEEVKELYRRLPAGSDPYEFISLAWLKKWLDEKTPTEPIDNNICLCCHGKLHPDKVSIMKRISRYAADIFYSRYGGGPRITMKSLCKECVVDRCRVIRLKNQLSEDHKIINSLLKVPLKSNEGFWVGKVSLRTWRQQALEQLQAQDSDASQSHEKMTTDTSSKREPKEESKETEKLNFNEDVLCSHGELCVSESDRRLVSKETWSKLQQYFPKAPQFPYYKESCSSCKILEREGEENEALHKMMACEQKMSLPQLFQDKHRPCLIDWPEDADTIYIVSQLFVEEWRKFVRRPLKYNPIASIENKVLLCPHGRLIYTYASMVSEDSKLVVPIWPAEWRMIQKLFFVDQAITIKRTQVGGGDVQYISDPELCLECREALLCQQLRELREYTKATIYVHKVEDTTFVSDSAVIMRGSYFKIEEIKEDKRDPDFSHGSEGKKRQKLTHPDSTPQTQGTRRSTRHRRTPGEKVFFVSAKQTLRDLKVQIMNAFSVATFDQHLTLNGKPLTDDAATLGNLGVTPECIISLKADEPLTDYDDMDDILQVRRPEKGFKGTGLLGH